MAETVFLVDIGASRDVVSNAVTTRDGIVSWWTTEAIVPHTPGEDMVLGFPDAPASFNLRIDEVGDDRVKWTSVGSFPPHWKGTEVIWNLTDIPQNEGQGTRLFFEHRGFAVADPMLGHTAFTWANLMNSLKSYCESGAAAPMFDVQG